MATAIRIKDNLNEKRAFASRVALMYLLACLLMAGVIVRMLQLQVWEHEIYQTRSEENRIQVQPLAPTRGLIYDRHGVLLADNRPVFSLGLVSEQIDDLDQTIADIGDLVPLIEEDLQGFRDRLKRQRRPFEPVALKLTLTEEEIARLAANRHRFPGMQITAQLVRHYPFGPLLSHAVGSVRRVTEEDLKRLDPVRYSATRFIGKRGVEQFYENSLHGEIGHQQVETDAHGRIRQVLNITPPGYGQNITLHLDSRLQIAASAALGDRRGAVVALDPRSGGILAMVSKPEYDPNFFVSGISAEQYKVYSTSQERPLFNRAVNGQYAPGSTFKPIVAMAALTHGVTTWDEIIDDRGSFKLPNQARIYRNWSWKKNNSGGQGPIAMRRAIYRSSNVYFYHMASRLHIDQLASFTAQFGIGQVTSVDVADASRGLLPDPIWKLGARGERWYPGDNINVGIGQGDLLVTPLQLATVAMVIANRGHFVRPQMLMASDGPLAEFDPPPPMKDVQGPTPEDWENLVDAMEDVVHRGNQGFRGNGTAWAYIGQNIGYRMAGKSGTAQVVGIKQGEEYEEEELDEFNRKHAWFIAFAPADDPQIAIAVLVENGGGGSSVAAPVAREVIDAFLLPQIAHR
ncbi:MAG: penicillin-binding protein 2 [Proteobacteria bacterium]|nr:penicillin-binding protein 2 [Pseudomonadota bacterium]